MTDPTSDPTGETPAADASPDEKPVFTKEPQPDLPLALRKQKAGMNKNRIGIWIVLSAFALYLIITGIVGILTKAR